MQGIKKITLVLNTDDPEQMELFRYVNSLPNGQKRNSSAFLRTLVDREYQKKREEYLEECRRFVQEKKTQAASSVEVSKTKNGGIKYLVKKDLSN
jgi:hypothetical protein